MYNKSMFFLPFFMFSGVAGQLLGFVLFFVLFALNKAGERRKEFLSYSFLFFVVWAIFPLSNFFHNYFFYDSSLEFTFPQILKSHIPSSCLVASFCFFVLSFLKRKESKETGKAFDFFLLGLTVSIFFLFSYAFFQAFWGFDYRLEGMILPKTEIYGDRYRASGFYGHPLSLASVSLGIFGFCLFLFGRGQFFTPRQRKQLLFCSVLAFFLIFLTGSRVSSALAVIFAIFFVFKRRSWLLSLIIFIFCLGLFYFSGLYERVYEFYHLTSLAQIPRFIFWKVHLFMIWDSPFFGHGYVQTKYYMTNYYYELLGLSEYFRKYSAHNIYLQTLTEIGFLGFLVLSFCLIFLMKILKKLSHPIFYQAFLFSIFLNMLHGLTQNTFFDASLFCVYLYFFLLLRSGFRGSN